MFCALLCFFVNARNTLAVGDNDDDNTSTSTTILLTNTSASVCVGARVYLDRHDFQAKNLEFSTKMTNVTLPVMIVIVVTLSNQCQEFAFDPTEYCIIFFTKRTHTHSYTSRRVRALKGQQTYLNGVRDDGLLLAH